MLFSTQHPKETWDAMYINYAISDGNATYQYTSINAVMQFIDITSGGLQVTTEILLNGEVQPEDNTSGRVGIALNREHISAGKSIVDSIIPCPPGDIEKLIPFVVTYYITKIKHSEKN